MRMSQPGPPGQANAALWQRWLLPAAIVGFLVLLTVPRGAAPGTPLTYTQFVADVGAGTVHAVTIGPVGQVTGSLTSGQPFTTTIPVALGGNGLAGNLAAHHVQVTATAAATSSPLLSVLIGLLPLLLISSLIYFVIRSVRRQAGGLGGGLGHLNSLTKAKARVIDAERPATRFTDVAGYTTVKTEISEVVDYLRDPGRWHRAGARGFEDSGGVVVLAATNRPDALDPALRRPGRFDREVLVPLPGRAERAAILAAHARGKNLGPDADLDQVAAATPGFSGADLAGLLNEAAVTAVRSGRTTLTAADFAAARDRVLLGTRHASPLTPGELATVAVHEAGHALVATLSPYADPVTRVTVLGAGQALGLTETLPADDRRLLRGEVPGRYPRGPPRRPGRRAPDLRRGLHRRRRRPGRRDRPGHSDGPRVRPQPGDRPGQLHQPARRPPRAARPARLLRAHPMAGRPGSRRPADQRRNPRPGPAHPPPRSLAQLTAALLEQETVTGDQVRALAWAATTTACEPPSSTIRISR